MPYYKVIKESTHRTIFYVGADNEDAAKRSVRLGDCNYSDVIANEGNTSIVSAGEWTDLEPYTTVATLDGKLVIHHVNAPTPDWAFRHASYMQCGDYKGLSAHKGHIEVEGLKQ